MKRFNIFIYLMTLLAFISSCTLDEDIDINSSQESYAIINTHISATYASNDLCSLGDAERVIRNIRIYAFDNGRLDVMVKQNLIPYQTEVTIAMQVTQKTNKSLYVIINEPQDDMIQAQLEKAVTPLELDEIQYQMAHYFTNMQSTILNSSAQFGRTDFCLPMFGKIEGVNTVGNYSETNPKTISLSVTRSLARFDIYMQKSRDESDVVCVDDKTRLAIGNTAVKGYIAPHKTPSGDLIDIAGNGDTTPLEIPMQDADNSEKLAVRAFSFYTPERTYQASEKISITLTGMKFGEKRLDYNPIVLGEELTKIERNKVHKIYCKFNPNAEEVTYKIIVSPWGVVPTQDESTEKGEINMVNCYMVTPGGSVTIPVQNVYRFWSWSDDLSVPEPISKEMEVVPEVIWTDTEDLITSVDLLNIPNLTDKKDHARIRVQTAPGKQGNAVIGMRMKSEDGTLESDYRWSWHVWVTGYNPLNADSIFTKDGVTFMNRNLGALTDHYNAEGTVQGLIYQWGRKDPFPTKKEWFGDDIHYPQNTIKLEQVIEPFNLTTAIKNPASFYFNRTDTRKGDWYSSTGEQNDNLWRNNIKTIYDPCPEGWRVPSSEILIWNGRNPYTEDWDDLDNEGLTTINIGFYPFTAVRPHVSGVATYGSSSGGFWFSGIYTLNTSFAACLAYNLRQPSSTAGFQRATGKAVRCVKE